MRATRQIAVLSVAGLISCVLQAGVASGQPARTAARLESLLKRFPEADANKDGKLTIEEARAYRQQMIGARDAGLEQKDRSGGKKRGQQTVYTIKPDYADLRYGPHEKNGIDLWLVKTDDGSPTPLAVYIHGGGFRGGDKTKVSMGTVRRLLDAGVSVATINYRLTDIGSFPMQMHDGARAIQFLRYHADRYNLNKERFACFGGSAGGCMSMWLGFHDDLADPDSTDPVLRESTRLTCIAPTGGQSVLDPDILADWFQCDNLQEHAGGRPLFGIKELDELERPEVKALIKEASPLTHLTEDDPPIFMTYGKADLPVDETTPAGTWVHHPRFGIKLKEIMDSMRMEVYVKYKGGPEVTEYSSGVEFMIKKLKG